MIDDPRPLMIDLLGKDMNFVALGQLLNQSNRITFSPPLLGEKLRLKTAMRNLLPTVNASFRWGSLIQPAFGLRSLLPA